MKIIYPLLLAEKDVIHTSLTCSFLSLLELTFFMSPTTHLCSELILFVLVLNLNKYDKDSICTFYEYCSHGNGTTVNAKLNLKKLKHTLAKLIIKTLLSLYECALYS